MITSAASRPPAHAATSSRSIRPRRSGGSAAAATTTRRSALATSTCSPRPSRCARTSCVRRSSIPSIRAVPSSITVTSTSSPATGRDPPRSRPASFATRSSPFTRTAAMPPPMATTRPRASSVRVVTNGECRGGPTGRNAHLDWRRAGVPGRRRRDRPVRRARSAEPRRRHGGGRRARRGGAVSRRLDGGVVRDPARPCAGVRPPGAVALAVALPIGLLLRAATGRGDAPAFVVVAAIFLGLTLVGRRWLVGALARRRGAGSEPASAGER